MAAETTITMGRPRTRPTPPDRLLVIEGTIPVGTVADADAVRRHWPTMPAGYACQEGDFKAQPDGSVKYRLEAERMYDAAIVNERTLL